MQNNIIIRLVDIVVQSELQNKQIFMESILLLILGAIWCLRC